VTAHTIAEAKRTAIALSRATPRPLFYREKTHELDRARALSRNDRAAHFARDSIRTEGSVLGHDFYHAHRVAHDAAAIVYCERGDDDDGLARLALVAGYLHDIRRNMRDHSARGAEAVVPLLANILPARDIAMVAVAIRDHEAFRERVAIDDDDARLLADALYDADKFRWGPDNFTYTIWSMARSLAISVDDLVRHYQAGIAGITRIRDTFRTDTGRRYGPDFIDRGLELGGALYAYLTERR